jgi:hypothetical protein
VSLSGKIMQHRWRVHHHLQNRVCEAGIAEILQTLCMTLVHLIGRPCYFDGSRPEILCAVGLSGSCSRRAIPRRVGRVRERRFRGLSTEGLEDRECYDAQITHTSLSRSIRTIHLSGLDCRVDRLVLGLVCRHLLRIRLKLDRIRQ